MIIVAVAAASAYDAMVIVVCKAVPIPVAPGLRPAQRRALSTRMPYQGINQGAMSQGVAEHGAGAAIQCAHRAATATGHTRPSIQADRTSHPSLDWARPTTTNTTLGVRGMLCIIGRCGEGGRLC